MSERIFISHASEDAAVAEQIVAYLEARGVPCWISSRDIQPRAIYADAIVEGMQACSACAVLVSAASNASKAVKREVELASHEDKAFIPIRIDGSEPASGLAYYLRNAQWLDYGRNGERALERILEAPRTDKAPRAQIPRRDPLRHTLRVGAAVAILVVLGLASFRGVMAWLPHPGADASPAPSDRATEPTQPRADAHDPTSTARINAPSQPDADGAGANQEPPASPVMASIDPEPEARRPAFAVPEAWAQLVSDVDAVVARADQTALRARRQAELARQWALRAQSAQPGARVIQTSRGTYAGQTEDFALTWRPNGLGVYVIRPARGQSDGDNMAGAWAHGALVGVGVIETYSQNDGAHIVYEGDIANGEATGHGAIAYPDGARYQGQVVSGVREGLGRQTSAEGAVYIGAFSGDRRNGRGIEFDASGEVSAQGAWRSGQLE